MLLVAKPAFISHLFVDVRASYFPHTLHLASCINRGTSNSSRTNLHLSLPRIFLSTILPPFHTF